MESKTLAVFDSTLWFIRVGIAVALLLGTMSDAVNSKGRMPYPHLEKTALANVQLVKRLPERKVRKQDTSASVALKDGHE